MWSSVKNVSYEKVVNFASEEFKKKYEKYSNSGQHVVDHELGYDAVGIVKIATGGFLITGIKETGEKIGKNVSKYGQKLDEIGEILEDNLIKGKYSKRIFNPNEAGGKILNLSWKNIIFNKNDIKLIKKHLSRFEDVEANRKMISRLEKIEKGEILITDYDKRFYTHELREYERYKNLGIKDGVNDINAYENLHSATLEDYQIYELDSNNKSILYHPEIEKIDFYSDEDRKILGL